MLVAYKSYYSYGNVFYLLVKMRNLSPNVSGDGIKLEEVS